MKYLSVKKFILCPKCKKRSTLVIKRFVSSLNLSSGRRGQNILIDFPEKIRESVHTLEEPYLLQEFIDTSAGIPNIATGTDDLRVIIIGGEVIMASIRTPAPGKLLANVAQGGTIKEISLHCPAQFCAQRCHRHTRKNRSPLRLSLLFNYFGISHNRAYVFELNDRIGFPNDSMPSAHFFAEKLADQLLKKSQNRK